MGKITEEYGLEKLAKSFYSRAPDSLRAALILGLVIVLVYGEVSFFGYTLNPTLWNYGVLNVPQYGYEGRWPNYAYVVDPMATAGIWPIYAIASRTLVSGQIPLWNPFWGVGAPLAADPGWAVYYPLNILYLISNQYWDFVWFLELWLAGILCYLLLRDLRLSFISSLTGGLAYCMSGAFILHPFVPWTAIAVLTPALLLSAKRCFDRPLSASSISIGSIVLATSILGGHIETLLIQFLFINLFVLFEVIVMRRKNRMRGVVSWAITVLLGFGIAAFFILPVLEYLLLAVVARSGDIGVRSLSSDGNPMTWLLMLFVPYFFGFLQTYPYPELRQVFNWDISPGYVGMSVFFLASLALFSIGMRRRRKAGYSVFFLGAAFLVLMKIFGVPPVNWIGYLPVLSHVVFPRYSGSVLAMSFSGACAFGLESVLDRTSSIRSLRVAILFPLLVVLLATLATIPVPASPSSPFFIVSMVRLMGSLLFLFLAFAVSSIGGTKAARALMMLIILELTIYVPKALPDSYEDARLAICSGAAMVLILYLHGSKLPLVSVMAKRIPLPKLSGMHVCGLAIIIGLLLQSAVAGISPTGLPNRYDGFTEAPYVSFLKSNTGNQRVYSLNGVLVPNFSGLFSIQHLGFFSAVMPNSFRKFSLLNLDRGAFQVALVGDVWGRQQIPSVSSEIRENIAFYSLLGVKYFVTDYTDLSEEHTVLVETDYPASLFWIYLGNRSFSTSFVTDIPFDDIVVRIGTYDRVNRGLVTLVLDSIPYNKTLHRVSHIEAESIVNGAYNKFSLERVEIVKRTEFKITLSQSDSRPENEVAIMIWPQAKQNPNMIVSGSFQINDETLDGYTALGLGLESQFLQAVYHDQNVTIYENSMAFPRAFLVNNMAVVQNEDQAILKTNELGWNTRNVVVLEEGLPTEHLVLVHAANGGAALGSAEIEEYSANEVVILTNASSPSFLVLTDLYYPGWACYVDGRQDMIYRAYGVVRAVFVEQGSHRIVFRYESDSFRIGSIISVVSLACALLLLTKRRVVRSVYLSRNRE